MPVDAADELGHRPDRAGIVAQDDLKTQAAGVASAVATAVTHPQLWAAAYWAYPRFPYWPAILVLEALVIGAEGVLIAWMAQLTLPRAMIVSLIANSSSFLFGLWLAS